jgi:hypothetical protein
MSFEESPSLDLYKDGLPSHLPDPSRRRKVVRKIIAALTVVVLGLLVLSLWQNGVFSILAGKGTVTGVVFDDQGSPIQAEVSVAGGDVSVQSDEDGHFVLNGVPSGSQVLVIGYRAVGREVLIQVTPGQSIDIGNFHFSLSDFQTSWGQPR